MKFSFLKHFPWAVERSKEFLNYFFEHPTFILDFLNDFALHIGTQLFHKNETN